MNICQSDEALLLLQEAGVVEMLVPLLAVNHYIGLKATMVVILCCRQDEGNECMDLIRREDHAMPKIVTLLQNTVSGRGGEGYKYGAFALRVCVGCVAALASTNDAIKARLASGPGFSCLLRVIHAFCVDGGIDGTIVGGGRDDPLSATLAMKAFHSLFVHLGSGLTFRESFEDQVLATLKALAKSSNPDVGESTKRLVTDVQVRIQEIQRQERLVTVCAALN